MLKPSWCMHTIPVWVAQGRKAVRSNHETLAANKAGILLSPTNALLHDWPFLLALASGIHTEKGNGDSNQATEGALEFVQ